MYRPLWAFIFLGMMCTSLFASAKNEQDVAFRGQGENRQANPNRQQNIQRGHTANEQQQEDEQYKREHGADEYYYHNKPLN